MAPSLAQPRRHRRQRRPFDQRPLVAQPPRDHRQLSHRFETMGCVRVELKTDARNTNSQRAMARITDDDWPEVKARLRGMLAQRWGLRALP
jgi:hypothetical protein